MDAMSIKFMIVIAVLMLGGFPLLYKIGYDHGNRYQELLFSSFKEDSTYEVLAFCISDNGDGSHIMFLKNLNENAEYPLAAVKGEGLAHKWFIGETIVTNDKKEILPILF